MFGFLKDKLKKAVAVFTKATTDETEEQPQQPTPQPEPVTQAPAEQPKKTPSPKPAPTQATPKPAPQTPPPKAPPTQETPKAPQTPQTQELPKPTPTAVEEPAPITAAQPAEEPSIDGVDDDEELVDESLAALVKAPVVSKAPAPQDEPDYTEKKPLSADQLLAEAISGDDADDELELDDEPLVPAPVETSKPVVEKTVPKSAPTPTPTKSTPPAPKPTPPASKPTARTAQPSEPVLKVERKEETTGFFGKLKAAVSSKKLSQEEFDELFSEMEIDLLENNVALDVVDKIRADLWAGLSEERFSRFSPEKRVQQALHESLEGLFLEPYDILADAKAKPKGEPYIICAVGVNGSGKTTTMGKLAYYFKAQGLSPVLAAGDTFRAAAIQQLEEHAKRVGVPIIKQQYGADAAAVAFDAIAYAKAHGHRVVLIDTAGRLHSNTNLMAELQKIVRVAKPDTTIFIGEATTGNDCVEQALEFQKAVDIDGIVLSKVDVDERGGAALSISYVTRRPILFFGTGQTYDDLTPFNKEQVLASLVEE